MTFSETMALYVASTTYALTFNQNTDIKTKENIFRRVFNAVMFTTTRSDKPIRITAPIYENTPQSEIYLHHPHPDAQGDDERNNSLPCLSRRSDRSDDVLPTPFNAPTSSTPRPSGTTLDYISQIHSRFTTSRKTQTIIVR